MRKEILFFWIPKAAGTSVFTILSKYNCPILMKYRHFINFKNKGNVTFGHVDLNYLLKHKIVKEDYFKKVFKFCIVRNPWDRLVSLYFYQKYDKFMTFEHFVQMIHKRYLLQKSPIYDNVIFKKIIYNTVLFRALMNNILRNLNKISYTLSCFFPVPPIGPYNVFDLSQANPQLDWIIDKDGNLLVDLICRFENIEKDFEKVCNIVGIDEHLPHDNETKRKEYRRYYNKKTENMVKEIYKKDIEFFQYKY